MKKICIIFGGKSGEHDISIITGLQLGKNLSNVKEVEKIYFGLDNKFYLATKVKNVAFFEDKTAIKLKEVYFYNNSVYLKGLFNTKICDIECVINCCHGGPGENGDLSSYFNILGIKYVGSNSLPSHIAMDKFLCKQLVKPDIPVVKGLKVTKENFVRQTKKIDKTFPNHLIVKPNSLGSSIGVKACTKKDYKEQIQAIFELNDQALVEEQIENLIELNQACFKDENELVLSAIEQPKSKTDVLTFNDKYENKSKGGDRTIPAKISHELTTQIGNATKKIYSLLEMNGVCRIDYIYDVVNEKLYFNEINSIPGSMAFYLFEPVGLDYLSLIEKLIKNCTVPTENIYYKTDILSKIKI